VEGSVGNLTDQFATMSMDVDQERVRLDWLEEHVGRLESELDVERSARVLLSVDLRQALDMCTTWVDRCTAHTNRTLGGRLERYSGMREGPRLC